MIHDHHEKDRLQNRKSLNILVAYLWISCAEKILSKYNQFRCIVTHSSNVFKNKLILRSHSTIWF